jgi:hypothetical protein
VDQRGPPQVEGDAPASHSKVLFRSGAPPRAAEVSELEDSLEAPEPSLVPPVGASRRWLRPAIAAVACALAVVGGCVAVRLWVLERPHLASTLEDSTATEWPASRASEGIPDPGTHRSIPTTQPEAPGTGLRKHAPGKRPLAPRPR